MMKQHIIAALAITFIILFGYNKLFFGGNFFTHEDWLNSSNASYGNSLGNGWRPDRGLGISHFFGDPAIWHAWSIYTLLEKIFHSRELAYNFSVILLSVAVAMTQYLFIRRIAPRSSPWAAVLLAPLIVFCADQAAYNFGRINIAALLGFTVLPMLLYDHFENPRSLHYFYAGFLFWFVAFASHIWSFFQLFAIGLAFSIFYSIYFRVRYAKILPKLIAIFISGGLGFVFLGCWIVYPNFLEKTLMEYTRERTYVDPQMTLSLFPDLKYLFNYFMGLIQAEWLPYNSGLLGVSFRPFLYTFNFSVIFPFVFLFFIFRRAKSFWEFSLKWFLVIFLLHYALEAIPLYRELYTYLCQKTSRIFTIYELVFPVQVGLAALFIFMMQQEDPVTDHRFGRRVQAGLALIVSSFFGLLSVVTAGAILWPDLFLNGINTLMSYAPERIGNYSRELLQAICTYNFERFRAITHWHTVAFYLTSSFLIAIFIKDKWMRWAAKQSTVMIAGLLLINGILLSWSIHPLNMEPSVWKTFAGGFEPTDRFYFVMEKKVQEKNLENFRKKYIVEGEGQRVRRRAGLLEPPGLNMAALKSFDTEMNWKFIYHIFNGDGIERIDMRLNYGGPLFMSGLLNMSAVNYYFSEEELDDLPQDLILYAKTKQLYVYKNLSAWPYYYLAEKLELKKEDRHLSDVRPGTAYLEQKDWFDLPSHSQRGKVDLKAFTYGTMVFDYDSPANEFLVVADSWHPFWKARLETGESLPVIRANEVFKGIQLPAGRHQVTMHFDTSLYKPGIYISIVSWILFFIGFWRFWRIEHAKF